MNREEGAISIYMALIFVIIISLICVMLEGARYQSIVAMSDIAVSESVDAVFADYASPLLEGYGLLFLWQGDAEFEKNMEEWLKSNIDSEEDMDEDNYDLYKMYLDEYSIDEIKHATDEGGSYYIKQISDYMKYQSVADGVSTILDLYDDALSLEGVKEYIEKIKKAKDKIEEITDAICDLYEVYEYAKETAEDISEDIEDIKNDTKKLRKSLKSFLSGDGDISFDDVKKDYENLQEKIETLNLDIKDLCTLKESGEDSINTYDENVTIEENTSDEAQEDPIIESWDLLNQVVQKEGELDFPDNKSDFINEDNIEKLIEENISGANKLRKGAKEIVDIVGGIITGEINDDTLSSMEEESSYGVSAVNFMDFIEDYGDYSILGLVTDISKVSHLYMEKDDSFPSRLSKKGLKAELSDEGAFSLYAGDVFNCFTDEHSEEGKKLLEYELEYIISGKKSDVRNLSVAVSKICELRMFTNLLAILNDVDKMNQVKSLSAVTFGLTGVPAITILGDVIISAAWAMGESIMDVRKLMAGERLHIIKSGQDFSLDLYDLPAVISGKVDYKKSSISNGLDYKQYLEIVLMFTNKNIKYHRSMDIIQSNIRNKGCDSFRLSECICRASVKMQIKSEGLFTKLPFVSDSIGEIGEIKISKSLTYMY